MAQAHTMGFDVDAFRAAHRPWSVTLGGQTYTARHVSYKAVEHYEHLMADAVRLTGSVRKRHATRRAFRWLLRRAFPWRPSYLVRGDPVRQLLALELPAFNAALLDFFACLQGRPSATALKLETAPTTAATKAPTTTPGTPSPAPTRRRRA